MIPDHVRLSLDRIKAEAKQRASASFSSSSNMQQKLRDGLKDAANNAAKLATRPTLDKFYDIFEEAQAKLRENLAQTSTQQNMLVFPEGTRFHQQGHYSNVLVVEQRPQTRTLTIDGINYKLAMPYSLFFISYTKEGEHDHHEGSKEFYFMDLNVGFMNTPLKSMEDDVHPPPFPNMGNTGVCMGTYHESTDNLAELAESCIGEFWMSEFEGSGQAHYDRKGGDALYFSVGKNRVVNFEQWQKLTEGNPLSVLEAKWSPPSAAKDIVERTAAVLDSKKDRAIKDVVGKAWNQMRETLTLETAEKVVRTAVEKTVTNLIDSL